MNAEDGTQLSSNWEKLQKTFKPSDGIPDNSHKRKRKFENIVDESPLRNKSKTPKTTAPKFESEETQSRFSRSIGIKNEAGIDNQNDRSKQRHPNPKDELDDKLEGLHPSQPEFAGRFIGMDCEMVGTGTPPTDSQLARVSIVSYDGHTLYDAYVRPVLPVTDYRTFVSGIKPRHLRPEGPAVAFSEVQKRVADLLQHRVLVGHALKNDLRALMLTHPGYDIRDTARWEPFRKLLRTKTPGLKRLAKAVLGWDVQKGEHDSVEDAKAAMELYKSARKEWEGIMAGRAVRRRKNKMKNGAC